MDWPTGRVGLALTFALLLTGIAANLALLTFVTMWALGHWR